MLYESTRNLLQSILQSLETDETRWDDQIESGNACLYEMHQMSGSLYKAYRSDSPTPSSPTQSSLPEKLNRAMPHVRTMVIAIRHKDKPRALESGKAALAEMNGARLSKPANFHVVPKVETKEVAIAVGQTQGPAARRRPAAEVRAVSPIRVSGGKRKSQ
jgi:hypothetical protein